MNFPVDIGGVAAASDLSALVHLTGKCHGDERPDCPIPADLASKRTAAA